MSDDEFPRLHLPDWLDDCAAIEVADRGWLDGATVELKSGAVISVSFYDPGRLAQDLEEEIGLGRPFIAEKRMIVVKEITPDAMRAAVRGLAKEGYFETEH